MLKKKIKFVTGKMKLEGLFVKKKFENTLKKILTCHF